MHVAGYRELGLEFDYVPFELEPGQLEGALIGMRSLGIRGFGVSMPFKQMVMPLLDHVDPLAERIGAVNTVVNDEGKLTGYNTDAWGARAALEEVTELSGKRVLLLGAGGAARAVAHGLAEAGAKVSVVNRREERARQLVEQARAAGSEIEFAGGLETLGDLTTSDIFVNASSAGMVEYGTASPLPTGSLRPGLVVLDIVYKPVETELVRAATGAGLVAIHGGRMLLHQATKQFELYTRRAAPVSAMDSALRAFLDL
jgi:shikimate dehydrogenase